MSTDFYVHFSPLTLAREHFAYFAGGANAVGVENLEGCGDLWQACDELGIPTRGHHVCETFWFSSPTGDTFPDEALGLLKMLLGYPQDLWARTAIRNDPPLITELRIKLVVGIWQDLWDYWKKTDEGILIISDPMSPPDFEALLRSHLGFLVGNRVD